MRTEAITAGMARPGADLGADVSRIARRGQSRADRGWGGFPAAGYAGHWIGKPAQISQNKGTLLA